jgi:hypothetical protein
MTPLRLPAPRRNKYHAQPVEADGHRFASKAEARRYRELSLLQRAGQISDLRVHPSWTLDVNGMFVSKYSADFAYVEGDRQVVEDVKGGKTTDAARLRMKLLQAVTGIQVREIRR